MKGFIIELTLQGDVLDEIELRDTLPGTEIRGIKVNGEDISPKPVFRDSAFFDTYREILASYENHILSNGKLRLSSHSFVYD